MATTTKTTDAEKAKPDPVGKPMDPEKVVLTDVPANEPYPTGGAPDPEDQFEAAHGFRRAPPKKEA